MHSQGDVGQPCLTLRIRTKRARRQPAWGCHGRPRAGRGAAHTGGARL